MEKHPMTLIPYTRNTPVGPVKADYWSWTTRKRGRVIDIQTEGGRTIQSDNVTVAGLPYPTDLGLPRPPRFIYTGQTVYVPAREGQEPPVVLFAPANRVTTEELLREDPLEELLLTRREALTMLSSMRAMLAEIQMAGRMPPGKDMSDGFGSVALGINRDAMQSALAKLEVDWMLKPLKPAP